MLSLRFQQYALRREKEALAAALPPYTTVLDRAAPTMVRTGNAWTQQLFDGAFYRSPAPTQPDLPIVNLVFVQSGDGNTIADNPQLLGGGLTDKHLVFEGLSRVDADAVLSGSITARSRSLVMSVWHPQLVNLRLSLGKPRHPMQVIVTSAGDLPFDDGLMFQEPELRTALLVPSSAVARLRDRLQRSPWVEIIDAGEPLSLAHGLRALAVRGVGTVTAIGGPRTAQALLDDELIADLYLTTSPVIAGVANTPFYRGAPLRQELVVEKAGTGTEAGVVFQHFQLRPGAEAARLTP